MGPESASRGRRDTPPPFVPVGDGGTSSRTPPPSFLWKRRDTAPVSPSGQQGALLWSSSPGTVGPPGQSLGAAGRDPVGPLGTAGPFPLSSRKTLSLSAPGSGGPPNQILGASGPPVRFRGRRYPQTRPWEWRAIASDPRSRGPPGMAAGPSGGRR